MNLPPLPEALPCRSRPPLQNRVDPLGALVATAARGMLMGNRGGRFHLPDQSLGRRRWARRQWISCLCSFRQRKLKVWGAGYTGIVLSG